MAVNSTAVTSSPLAEGYERYIVGQHIPEDGNEILDWNPVGDSDFGPRIRTMLEPGDVICTTRGPKLKVARIGFRALGAHTNFVIRPRDSAAIHPGYLEAVVRSDSFHDHLRKNFRGSVNLFVNWSDASKYEFALPAPEAQRRVANLLKACDDNVASLHRLRLQSISTYRSAALRVFAPDGARRIKPESWVPKGWRLRTLVELVGAPICYGIVQVGEFDPAGVPTIAINNMGSGLKTGLHMTASDIEKQYVRSRVAPGDALVSIKGTVGKLDIVPSGFEGNISRDIARIRLDDSAIAPDFFRHLFQSDCYQRYVRSLIVGTTRAELSIGEIRKMQVPLPALSTQMEVGQSLDELWAATQECEKRLGEASRLTKCAIEEALVGVGALK